MIYSVIALIVFVQIWPHKSVLTSWPSVLILSISSPKLHYCTLSRSSERCYCNQFPLWNRDPGKKIEIRFLIFKENRCNFHPWALKKLAKCLEHSVIFSSLFKTLIPMLMLVGRCCFHSILTPFVLCLRCFAFIFRARWRMAWYPARNQEAMGRYETAMFTIWDSESMYPMETMVEGIFLAATYSCVLPSKMTKWRKLRLIIQICFSCLF